MQLTFHFKKKSASLKVMYDPVDVREGADPPPDPPLSNSNTCGFD